MDKRRNLWYILFLAVLLVSNQLSSLLQWCGDENVSTTDMYMHVSDNKLPSTTDSVADRQHLLLSIPFYVYEELAWISAIYRNSTMEELAKQNSDTKHFDDYFFMKSSLVHPMRTMDPSVAKLFVIPTLMNSYTYRSWYSAEEDKLCYRNRCDMDLLETVVHTLRNSTWFLQYPERHLVVQSNWYSLNNGSFEVPNELKALLSNVTVITFEDHVVNQQERLRFPSTYVGTPCEIQSEKTLDFSLTASMSTDNVDFRDRVNICQWIGNSTSSITQIRMSHCGYGQRCPALAQAKYGFHARGDTFGSNRLIDTILSGTVPIFTRREQYNILPSWLDWRQISVLLPLNDVNDQGHFLRLLEDILQDTGGYNNRHHAVLQHRDLVDWNTLHPFDIYMYSLQAELYPETRHKKEYWEHIYPALNLPPPLS
jgi:Exostosin family